MNGTVKFCAFVLSFMLPALSRAAETPPPPALSYLELGASTGFAYDWLNGGSANPNNSMIATLGDRNFPDLVGSFSLAYRRRPFTFGAELGLGRQLHGGDMGFVSGGGFIGLDLWCHLRLRVHFFEQSIATQSRATVSSETTYPQTFTGVGGGVDLAYAVWDQPTTALQVYAGFDAANLSRESDSSGSGQADARLLRGQLGLRVLFDTRLGLGDSP